MYTRQEASAIREKFWISFGKYMAPVPSAVGLKANWINYRTGIKSISFKMDVTSREAYIAVEVFNKDSSLAEQYYKAFEVLKSSFEEAVNEKWEWQEDHTNDIGNHISRIFIVKKNVNVFIEKDWPEIISFFKTRIMALDRFWNGYRGLFEAIG